MKRILIVDDYETIRKIYKDHLVAAGFLVIEAGNVVDGLSEIIKADDIDVVLLDINLPGLRGDMLLRMAQDYDVHFKVIVCSTHTFAEQKEVIPDADDYFVKGNLPEVLIKKINKILKNI